MLDHPLRLAVGSHEAGTGRGCAMNVISWENGDSTITDTPACSDPVLARIVQRVNDTICEHRDGPLLCPDCSVKVLALGHRTVGTGGPADLARRRVWVRVAADQARQVAHLTVDRYRAWAAIHAAEAWAGDPTEANRSAAAAAYAAYAYTASASSAAWAAAKAAATNVYAAAYADAAYAAACAAACAAYADAAAAAADAANATNAYVDSRLRLAHRAIDQFYLHTGLTEHQPDPQRTAAALAAMTRA